jgi:formate/nitrite transporter FocA (FNT family)
MKPPAEKEENEKQVRERVSPPGEVVYEAIHREGEHELRRANRELAWSGLAAGLSMGFSFVTESLLRSHLPEARWAPAVSKLGYCIGFLIVILGRQQLFTKNTLTVILPLLNRRNATRVGNVARLWAVVLSANLAGALLFACLLAFTSTFDADVRAGFDRIGEDMPRIGFVSLAVRGVLAGWLIALMIWLMPFAESGRVWVIVLLAYVVGLAHLPHIIAGAVPAFYVVLTGQRALGDCVIGYLLPTFLGNAIGGVALVAALAHAELSEASNSQDRHR